MVRIPGCKELVFVVPLLNNEYTFFIGSESKRFLLARKAEAARVSLRFLGDLTALMVDKKLKLYEAVQLILKNLDYNTKPCDEDLWIPSFEKIYRLNHFPEITDAFKDLGEEAIKTVRIG